jgi:hypothetical protein
MDFLLRSRRRAVVESSVNYEERVYIEENPGFILSSSIMHTQQIGYIISRGKSRVHPVVLYNHPPKKKNI